jgi:hypothetical protein
VLISLPLLGTLAVFIDSLKISSFWISWWFFYGNYFCFSVILEFCQLDGETGEHRENEVLSEKPRSFV